MALMAETRIAANRAMFSGAAETWSGLGTADGQLAQQTGSLKLSTEIESYWATTKEIRYLGNIQTGHGLVIPSSHNTVFNCQLRHYRSRQQLPLLCIEYSPILMVYIPNFYNPNRGLHTGMGQCCVYLVGFIFAYQPENRVC